ncbi:LLM class flavin-dependent oxidoreductase [Streptomyces sp. NPDC020883]|uniref:LLM class flavin-dependent oxidoreductase n=1 Tax=Streptomyces sp. NPDC020883 TaxID=3365099 RepID=UPI003796BA63
MTPLSARPPKLSVLFPLQPDHPSLALPFVDLVARTGAHRLWLCQSLHAETHQSIAYLAAKGPRIPFGVSVTLMPLRHPYEAALQARSLALITDEPVVVGYGTGTPDFVSGLRPGPYPSPLTAAREYLASVRALLDGGPVTHRGDYHHLHARLPPLDHPRIEVGAGVLRPGMARVAAVTADTAITWLTPPDYIRDTLLPATEVGTDAPHQVPRPRPRIVTVVHAAVARPGRNAKRAALAGTHTHLTAAPYTDMLRRAGVPAHPSDPEAGAAALVDHNVFLTGTPTDIAAGLARHAESGVDEVVLNPAGVLLTEGTPAAVTDLEEIISAYRTMHS